MPPANTPDAPSPPQPSTTQQRPLTPLSYLSSPVPDLASTLHSHVPSAADEANTSFLRTSLHALENLPPDTTPQRAYVDPTRDPRRARRHESADDLSRRERLQRVLSRLNRLHDPQAPSTGAYGDRTPSPRRQALYDWAPAQDGVAQQGDVEAILRELRTQAPETSSETLRFLSAHLGSEGGEETEESFGQRTERRQSEMERAQGVRERVALRAGRESASPSATERMLRYVMERERSGMSEEEERARGGGWFRPTPRLGVQGDEGAGLETGVASGLLPHRANEIRERDRTERIEAFRRGYLAEHVPPRLPRISGATAFPSSGLSSANSTNTSPFLENALKYLSDLRGCTSYEEALAAAIDNNLATKEFFADKHDDFVTDLDGLATEFPAPSSWLQPGATFDGHQHASSASVNITHHPQPAASPHIVEQINPNYRSIFPQTSTPSSDPTRPWLTHTIPPAPSNPPASPTLTLKTSPTASPSDNWPVHVTLHTIDWPTKTLNATMRAYDVPQHPATLTPARETLKAGNKSAPITTYLEGHIIDLTTHTFLTPSPGDKNARDPTPTLPENATPYTTSPTTPAFPSATPALDAQNWLALPPFSSTFTTPSSLARTLLSRSSLAKLSEEYIFMRWKERCFVHSKHDTCNSSACDRLTDQDRGHGLTISGFYYVSLRRSDGEVRGLYFDPSSTPYQHLKLQGGVGGWGGWGFL